MSSLALAHGRLAIRQILSNIPSRLVKDLAILDRVRRSDVLRSSAHQMSRCFPGNQAAAVGHNPSRARLEFDWGLPVL